jgi:formate/nitrite transporter FocA (FNT family)
MTRTQQETGATQQHHANAVSDGSDGEAQKSYREILNQQVSEELNQLSRPTGGLLISGLSAGLDIGFSMLLMSVMYTLMVDQVSESVLTILIANMYSIGFIFVILGRSELFTEHTTLSFLPVLNQRASVMSVARLWGLIYSSNIVGCIIFTLILVTVGPELGVIDPAAFGYIGGKLVEPVWWVILSSAMLAGWLMGLLSWLVTASRDTVSQIILVWLITTAIGLVGLHHSIVGTVEVLSAVFSGQGVTLMEFGYFLFWTTLGNAIGGLVFVALIKYGHASQEGQSGAPV